VHKPPTPHPPPPTPHPKQKKEAKPIVINKIKEVPLYIYLGIILTSNIDFTQHIKVTLQVAHKQDREALLLGVRRGELHPERARKVWCAFVEPKFGYDIGLWLAGSDVIGSECAIEVDMYVDLQM
jgi:hypothetical protein